MSLSLVKPQHTELKPRIVVFGVGGAGGNAVNNMIDAGLEGVEFVVANTDAQHLSFAKTDRRIQLGETITQGLGAGAHPWGKWPDKPQLELALHAVNAALADAG